MVFRFRVCQFNEYADTAQGWVIASSEIQARSLIGDNSFFQHMPTQNDICVPHGTVFVTEGRLAN